jgi:hypothetical protein
MAESVSYGLPPQLDSYLSILARVYKKDNKQLLLKILANAAASVNERWEDDYGGRDVGHAIFLHLPDDLYAEILAAKNDLQGELRTDFNNASSVPYEYVAEVFLCPQGNSPDNWREESGAVLQGRVVSEPAQARIWEPNKFRVFLSHKSSVKVNTAALKDSLALFGISCFVAHEDIHPTKEWMDEIESALFSMDALVALMTDDFHDSDWTDQEVGVAMGRSVPIISVKLGRLNPYGFIGRFQALPCTWENAPMELIKLLICHEKMKEAYISALSRCPNFDKGNILADALPFIPSLTEPQAAAMIEAYKINSELRGSFGFNGTRPRYYGEGLQHHISRATGRDYSAIFNSLPWIGDI